MQTTKPVTQKRCPKCNSGHIDAVDYMGVKALICLTCGYDESSEMEAGGGARTNQKAKASYSPYKAGGSKRTR